MNLLYYNCKNATQYTKLHNWVKCCDNVPSLSRIIVAFKWYNQPVTEVIISTGTV